MMKFAASVSLAALALASCASTTVAPAAPAGPASYPMSDDGTRNSAAAPTVADAQAFVAAVEKDLTDLNVISQRAAWINNTYINDDSDAIAAYFGTIGTEKGVKYAAEAAKYAALPGLDFDTARKLNILRGALFLAAPSTPGAAA